MSTKPEQVQSRLRTRYLAPTLERRLRFLGVRGPRPCARQCTPSEGDAFGNTARGGHDCACCGVRIRPRTIEYQPRDHTALCAHMLCYILWRDETRRGGRPCPFGMAHS